MAVLLAGPAFPRGTQAGGDWENVGAGFAPHGPSRGRALRTRHWAEVVSGPARLRDGEGHREGEFLPTYL